MYLFILNIIGFAIAIFVYVSIYLWILELEKKGCQCSKLWHYEYLKYASVVLLVNIILFNLTRFSMIKGFGLLQFYPSKINTIVLSWAFLSILFIIPYFAILLDYIVKLKKMQDCKCSEDWKREFGYYYSIIYFASFLFLIINIIIKTIIIYDNIQKFKT